LSAPVLSWLFTARGQQDEPTNLKSSKTAGRKPTVQPRPSSSLCSAISSDKRPSCPTLRANPFPEVTDLFCRLPLPTLFYRPEAANLGDLMRILVRTGVQIKIIPSVFHGQSKAHRTSRKTRCFTNHLTLSPDKLISG
jgi:hypothetical protein